MMQFFHKITVLVLSLTTGLILVGCGGGSSSTTESSTAAPATTSSPGPTTSPTTTTPSKVGQSKLSVYLTDAPVEFEAVYVTISEVRVHREGTDDDNDDTNSTEDTNQTESSEDDDGEWITVATPNTTYNLLELQNGVTTLMGEETLPSGNYTQLRMILGNTPDGELNLLGEAHPHPHYIILDDDMSYALKVPSNTLKHVHNFTLVDGGESEMVIDFDAKKSIHEAGKSGKWLLQPVLQVKTELQ